MADKFRTVIYQRPGGKFLAYLYNDKAFVSRSEEVLSKEEADAWCKAQLLDREQPVVEPEVATPKPHVLQAVEDQAKAAAQKK